MAEEDEADEDLGEEEEEELQEELDEEHPEAPDYDLENEEETAVEKDEGDPPRLRQWRGGRNGPRSASSVDGAADGPSTPLKSPSRSPTKSKKGEEPTASTSSSASHKRPRGNLPNAPPFDGDRRKDPKCFRRWLAKVDSYIAIAEKIIGQDEIGLRLHAALTGEAADFLEDIPAKVFGEIDGWRVLVRILRDKFEETKMSKVGSAMKEFFQLRESMDKENRALTMRDVMEMMDKAARRCRDNNLDIPDPVMCHFFFQNTSCSTERQANLLLRSGGEYDWSKIKAAVDLLYANAVVHRPGSSRGGPRGRGAHEVHHYAVFLWFGGLLLIQGFGF